MVKRTKTIPLITYAYDVEDINKVDKSRTQCNHVYIQVYDCTKKKLLNFNNNYNIDYVCVNPVEYNYITIMTMGLYKKNYPYCKFNPTKIDSDVIKPKNTNFKDIISLLTDCPYASSKFGFLYNISAAQIIKQFIIISGGTLDSFIDFFNYLQDEFEGWIPYDWKEQAIDSINYLRSIEEDYNIWPKMFVRYDDYYFQSNTSDGFDDLMVILSAIFEVIFGATKSNFQAEAIIARPGDLEKHNRFFKQYTQAMAKRYPIVPYPVILLNNNYLGPTPITYRHDLEYYNLHIYIPSQQKQIMFLNNEDKDATTQCIYYVNKKDYSPLIDYIPYEDFHHPDLVPLFIPDFVFNKTEDKMVKDFLNYGIGDIIPVNPYVPPDEKYKQLNPNIYSIH